uniref:Uncharacterized protein n=1 Tax=Macaca mulatta TaxID=9544 RepID=A0A5F7ZCR4_MACMU
GSEGGDHSVINLSLLSILKLWDHHHIQRNLQSLMYYIFQYILFSGQFVHGSAGVLILTAIEKHFQGSVFSSIGLCVGFYAS